MHTAVQAAIAPQTKPSAVESELGVGGLDLRVAMWMSENRASA